MEVIPEVEALTEAEEIPEVPAISEVEAMVEVEAVPALEAESEAEPKSGVQALTELEAQAKMEPDPHFHVWPIRRLGPLHRLDSAWKCVYP